MFCVVYTFSVKQGQEETFIKAWSEMTMLIKTYEGGLGSRLHHKAEGEFIAYAQWPNKATWQAADGGKLPEKANAVRQNMRACTEKIEVLHELDMVKDLLI
jgi:heme-degrading monooxygenase HmoA